MAAAIELKAEVAGSVWKVLCQPGMTVAADETVILIESMKMEIPVIAEQAGTINEVLVAEGDQIEEGQVVARMTD